MAGYQPPPVNANGETLPNLSTPMLADDGGVTASNTPPGGGEPVCPILRRPKRAPGPLTPDRTEARTAWAKWGSTAARRWVAPCGRFAA